MLRSLRVRRGAKPPPSSSLGIYYYRRESTITVTAEREAARREGMQHANPSVETQRAARSSKREAAAGGDVRGQAVSAGCEAMDARALALSVLLPTRIDDGNLRQLRLSGWSRGSSECRADAPWGQGETEAALWHSGDPTGASAVAD